MKQPTQARHSRTFRRLLAALALLLLGAGWLAPQRAAAAPAPVALGFKGGAGGILDTGFTTTLPGTTQQSGNLLLTPANLGILQITSTGGDLASSTTQDNALAIQYSSSGAYTIQARMLAPIAFATSFQSGGIFIGLSNSSYIRLTAGVGSKRSNGERIQLDVADNNGKARSSTVALPAGTLARVQSSLDLFITIDQTAGKITALYRIDSNDPSAVRLATTRGFPRWMNKNNGALYAGVVTSSRAAAPVNVSFDWFELTTPVVATITGSKTVDKDGLSGPPINPGDTLTYTVGVTNNGPATTVTVTDPIPADTTFKGGLAITPNTLPTPVFSSVANRLTWSGTLATGQSATITFQVTINQAPLQSSVILNTALLSSAASSIPAQLSASTVVAGAPDLTDSSYSATPGLVAPNGNLTYALTLLNDGTSVANNTVAQLPIPAGTSYVPNSVQKTSGSASIDLSLSQISWNVGSLPINATSTLTFTVNVGAGFINGDPIASTAIMQANGTLPNTATAQALYSVNTLVGGTKTVDKIEADPGDSLTYTITVVNTSNAPASNLQLIDPIDRDASYLGNVASSPGAPAPSYDPSSRQVSWSNLTLAASQAITMSFQVAINGAPAAPLLHGAVLPNRATLTNGADGVQTLLSATTTVRGVPDLSGSVYTASPGAVGPNGIVTYELSLINNGTAAANNALAQLTLPAGTVLAGTPSATNGTVAFDAGAGKLNWSAAQVAIGGVVKIAFQAKLTGTFANGDLVSSQAVLQSDQLQPATKSAQAIFSLSAQAPQSLNYMPLIAR